MVEKASAFGKSVRRLAGVVACLAVTTVSAPALRNDAGHCLSARCVEPPSMLAQATGRKLNARPDPLPAQRNIGTSADVRKGETRANRNRDKEAQRAAREEAAAKRKRAAEERRGAAGTR